MDVNKYQTLAMTTLNKDLSKKDVLINAVMGLCGESGEVIDIVKKHLHQGHELDKEKLIKIGTNAKNTLNTSWKAVADKYVSLYNTIINNIKSAGLNAVTVSECANLTVNL